MGFFEKKNTKWYLIGAAALLILLSLTAFLGYRHWQSNKDCADYLPRESGIVSDQVVQCALQKALKKQTSALCQIANEETGFTEYIGKHEDECYYQYAVRQRFAEACDKVIDLDKRAKCKATVEGVFDNEEDITYCWSRPKDKIAQCLMELAVKEESTLICDTAQGASQEAEDIKAACLYKYATFTNDPEICHQITKERTKTNCLNKLSDLKENEEAIGECQKIVENGPKKPEDYRCFLRIALDILNPAICKEGEQWASLPIACYTGYAIARQDAEICSEIEQQDARERCDKIVTLSKNYPFGPECWNKIDLKDFSGINMDSCLLDMAFRMENSQVCNLGLTPEEDYDSPYALAQNECYFLYAIEDNNESLCDKIFPDGSMMIPDQNPQECKNRIQFRKKHPEFEDWSTEWTWIAMQLKDEQYCEYEQHYNDSVTLLPKENCLKHMEVLREYPDAGIEAHDHWAAIAKKTGNAAFCEYHAGETKNRMDFCLDNMDETDRPQTNKTENVVPVVESTEGSDDPGFIGEWF